MIGRASLEANCGHQLCAIGSNIVPATIINYRGLWNLSPLSLSPSLSPPLSLPPSLYSIRGDIRTQSSLIQYLSAFLLKLESEISLPSDLPGCFAQRAPLAKTSHFRPRGALNRVTRWVVSLEVRGPVAAFLRFRTKN